MRNFERLEAPNPSELRPTRDRSEVAAKLGEIAVGTSVETDDRTASFWEVGDGTAQASTEQTDCAAAFWKPVGETALGGAEVTLERN